MSSQPEHHHTPQKEHQTPDILFSDPACTHIICPTRRHPAHRYPIENIHLERHANGFKATYSDFESSVFVSGLRVEDFSDLEAFYQQHSYGRDAIWQNISDYPSLPYNTRYNPFIETINVWMESPQGYIVYGSVEITKTPAPWQKLLRPLGTWLIVEHPESTAHVVSTVIVGGKRGKHGVAFNNFLHRKGFYKFIRTLRAYVPFSGKQRVRIEHHPEFLAVYGQPPMNWREAEQHSISIEMLS